MHPQFVDQWRTRGGIHRHVPPENCFWYALLMESGDHYGRKLLKPAFPSWFFSQIIHLYVNRYFERFGEPIPVGRAPFDAEIDDGSGGTISGKAAMENVLEGIRNRAIVTLPSDRTNNPQGGKTDYEFTIEYLESQMRGADFERYLQRLDEEMSLGIFTPVLLYRTADALGMIEGELAKVDVEDLGLALGMKITEVRQVTGKEDEDEDRPRKAPEATARTRRSTRRHEGRASLLLLEQHPARSGRLRRRPSVPTPQEPAQGVLLEAKIDGGSVRFRCRSCDRWHSVLVRRPATEGSAESRRGSGA